MTAKEGMAGRAEEKAGDTETQRKHETSSSIAHTKLDASNDRFAAFLFTSNLIYFTTQDLKELQSQ